MIYQCSGCNQDKDDDKDIGTLIGEDYYCEGCFDAKKSALIEKVKYLADYGIEFNQKSLVYEIDRECANEIINLIIESLKGE